MLDFDHPGPDYQLRWPKDIFRAEAQALLNAMPRLSSDAFELLFEEAFVGRMPAQQLRDIRWSELPLDYQGEWDGGAGSPIRTFTHLVLDNLDQLQDNSTPRPYWNARKDPTPDARPDATTLRNGWIELIRTLQAHGYLDQVAPRPCVDDDRRVEPDAFLEDEIRSRIGIPELWPLSAEDERLDDDTLYTLIEVFHDLVARPRTRYPHRFNDCGYHYSTFAYSAGQALYRARVNALLQQQQVGLELADAGEDTGRLISTPADPRRDLITDILEQPPTPARDTAAHAIALFRRRGASPHDKRSACIALAGLLEERRQLLKDELLSGDEGALFLVANKFAIRHRNADQHADYDDAYLDWLFWWYLATIELTERLLARSASGPTA